MTDQANEMNESEANEVPLTSSQEKFLGVRSKVGKKSDEQEEDVFADASSDTEAEKKLADSKKSNSQPEDGELNDYSEKVQKRINKLTFEREEARRQREEALKVARHLNQQNTQYQQENQHFQNVISKGEAHLIESIKQKAATALEKAKSEYAKAYEEGDTNAILEANEKMLDAKSELFQVSVEEKAQQQRALEHQKYLAHQQAMMQQQMRQNMARNQQTQQQRQQTQISPEMKEWAEKNKTWFDQKGYKPETGFAYGLHQEAVDEGHVPESPEYMKYINERLKQYKGTKIFPHLFGGSQPTNAQRQVVASADRNNSSKATQYRLNPDQRRLAKVLGITPEQYAKQYIKDYG